MIRARLSFVGIVFVASAAVSLLSGCGRSRSEAPHERLSSVAPLRQAFNADSGKVRAIFLTSPT